MAELTEDDLMEVNALVARHHRARTKTGGSPSILLGIELELLRYGVRLKHAVGPPDPHAPPGGQSLAMRAAA